MSSEAIANAIPKALLSQVCSTFSDSQHHSSSHRKNVHTLIKLQQQCASQGEEGERHFFLSFLHCLHHVLSVRKNEDLSNKMMRFVCGFLVRLCQQHSNEPSAMRFVENALLYALDNIDAKDKYVRSRLAQIVVAGVSAVEEVGDGVWQLLQVKMVERLYDKEAMVRVHAIHALSRLQSLLVNIKSSDGPVKKSIHELMISVLLKDPSSEVRKAALTQIDILPDTIDFVLTRARDVDPTIRKLFFTRKMREIDIYGLSLEQRDFILKSGLTDRDEMVKKQCVEMIFSVWLPKTSSNLVQFLTSLDVVMNRAVAESALEAFFVAVPDLFSSFPDSYFEHLTVETAFILACWSEHHKRQKTVSVSESLPELSKLAATLLKFHEYLVAVDGDDAAKAEVEFIVSELMTVIGAMMADDTGGDEVGRRQLRACLEDILLNMNISDELFVKACELMRHFVGDLTDHVNTIVSMSADFESVSTMDTAGGSSEEDEQVKIMALLRSVSLISVLLKTSDLSISRFPVLLTVLNTLIIPAVNSRYAVVQAAGLECLGLFAITSLVPYNVHIITLCV